MPTMFQAQPEANRTVRMRDKRGRGRLGKLEEFPLKLRPTGAGMFSDVLVTACPGLEGSLAHSTVE